MELIKIDIKQLFGLFDYLIPLNAKERITILHGPNGVGKTTILRMLHDVLSGRFLRLQSVPFKSLTLFFSDRRRLEIIQKPTRKRRVPPKLIARLWEGRKKSREQTLFEKILFEEYTSHLPIGALEDFIPPLERVEMDIWYDRSTEEIIPFEEVISRYGRMLPPSLRRRIRPQKPQPWLLEIVKALPTHFIQTQRLFTVSSENTHERRRSSQREPRDRPAVVTLSADMVKQIGDHLGKSGSLAAFLDRGFPGRLLRGTLPNSVTEKAIRNKYQTQADYGKRLMEAGLIDVGGQVTLPEKTLDVNDQKVLWYHLEDVKKKLSVFDELLKKVELFRGIIKERFRYKTFSLDKDKGFVFTAPNGGKVPLNALSSGEQHELVLAYTLLFKVREKSIILIDEPELSLHVSWQRKFLGDIKKISELADLDFIVATHSPSIIHNHTDLMVELKETK